MRSLRIPILIAVCLLGEPAGAADTIRLAVQKTGTLAWELDIIRAHGIDRKANLQIETIEHGPAHARRMARQIRRRAPAPAFRMPEPTARALLRCLLPPCGSSDLGRVCSQGVTRIPRGHWASESASVGWTWG